MSRIGSKDTIPEMIVRRLVHKMGFRYRLHVATLPGKPDLVFARLKRIVEVRGCFWHQHEGCSETHVPKTRRQYWGPKLKRNKVRDREHEKELNNLGWRVLTIWECEVKKTSKLQATLKRFLGDVNA